MKISEALACGASKAQALGMVQAPGSLLRIVNGDWGECCALGAVSLCEVFPSKHQITVDAVRDLYDTLEVHYPDMGRKVVLPLHPTRFGVGGREVAVLTAIWMLNDAYAWSFDQIKTWLEEQGL